MIVTAQISMSKSFQNMYNDFHESVEITALEQREKRVLITCEILKDWTQLVPWTAFSESVFLLLWVYLVLSFGESYVFDGTV